MKTGRGCVWILFPLPAERHRAYSFASAIASGLEPSMYKSMLHEEPIIVEALLDFKIWGKSPSLTCYFRNICTGEKFRLSAFDNSRDRRYTPRDKLIDFSECGIENGIYRVATVKTKKELCAWQSAELILPPSKKDEILAKIANA
jgi:hypothetical protein